MTTPKQPATEADGVSTMHDDLLAIYRALGLSDHARPYSPHEGVVRDVLPAIGAMRADLLALREALEVAREEADR